DSPLGRQRYYNKAELVIVVTDAGVNAFAKAPFSTTTYSIPAAQLNGLITTNDSFTDQREGKTVKVTELDVGEIEDWSTSNPSAINAIAANKPVNHIYIADNRSVQSSQSTAVRLKNGRVLPDRGLTVATPNPLYVQGHYNQPTSSHLGTTHTSNTKPASLASDALTVLSPSWQDSKSSSSYTKRNASDMTINA